MIKEDKGKIIDALTEKISKSDYFYITDFISLTVEEINNFRRKCFENNVEFKVIKNSLIKKALEKQANKEGYEELYEALKGSSALMFTETANVPAKLIKEFRKKHEKPILKAAYIDSSVFLGDDKLDQLESLKSKEELIGDIIILLQSPVKGVVGSISSAGNTLSGLLKALEERAQ